MTEFAFLVAVMFLPGIIWTRIADKFTKRTNPPQLDVVLNSLVFGLVAHFLTFYLYQFFGKDYSQLSTEDSFGFLVLTEFSDEITASTLVAILLAIAWVYVVNWRVPIRIMRRVRATKVFDEDDVWDFTFNQVGKSWEYVNVRDYKNSRTYSGYVKSWSDANELRELLLANVRVFDLDSSDLLYSMPYIYLSRLSSEVTVEFPLENKEL